jgi:hypothetical protein
MLWIILATLLNRLYKKGLSASYIPANHPGDQRRYAVGFRCAGRLPVV